MLVNSIMNKIAFCTQTRISTNAIAKMGKNELVSMNTMDKICKVLYCNIGDVMNFVADEDMID